MKRFFVFLMLFAVTVQFAQGVEWIKANYTKKEYRIKMRDGVKLFTSVYSPKDTTKTYPIIMVRTPYTVAPYGENKFPASLGPNEELARAGYIFAYQDVRGQFMSEGKFDNMRAYIPNKKSAAEFDESTDAYDTIDWLVKNAKHNNGNVGIWGISYPGFYAAMSLLNSHPALKAVSPQAPISDWFAGDDMHHNGILALSMAFNFLSNFDFQKDSLVTTWPDAPQYDSPDMYNFFLNLGSVANADKKYLHGKYKFWNAMTEHGAYDEFWKVRSNLPHFNNIKPAVLIVGGWYDSEDLYGPLNIYQSIEKKNSSNNNHLVMGPWSHGGWARTDGASFGDIKFPESTSAAYNKKIINPFFNYYLKGIGTSNLAEAITYRTGSNEWVNYNEWPPANRENKTLYLAPDQKLSWNTPVETENNFEEYVSDPNKPVPYTAKFYDSRQAYLRTYMNEDQRFAYSRPDVLSFSTEVLENDVVIAGPINVNLFVSTTGTDADWIVKVIDVYPDSTTNISKTPDAAEMGGYQNLVRFDGMRGKFRNSLEKPEPLEQNKITNVKFVLNDIDHNFRKGHKIMVQIQSSFFPFFDRNPQQFLDIYNAKDEDFHKAYNRVYFSNEYPTSISFVVVK